MLCDDIFGENNFIGTLIWRKKYGGGQTDEFFVTEHEYIFGYRKSKDFKWLDKNLEANEKDYKYKDAKGNYSITKLEKWGSSSHREDRPTMYFSIKDPDNNDLYPIAPDGKDGRWRVGKSRLQSLIENDEIHWVKDLKNNRWIPYEKNYLENSKGKLLKSRSIIYDLAETGTATKLLTNIFDEKYEQTIKQELGNNAHDTKVVFLKNEYKNISLKKLSFDSSFDGFDERQTFNILYDYYVNEYGLTTRKKDNKTILESKGYTFKNTIENYIVQDKIVRLNSDELENANRIKVESKVSTNKNGFELRNSINIISSKIGIRYDRTRLMLERMFLKSKMFTKKFVDLTIPEFYAFVINNEDKLKHDFQDAVSQKARQTKLKLEELHESDWKAPEMDYIKYDPKMKDTMIYEKSIYMNYPNSTIKSKSERMFENYCETSDNIKWFYKNGESSSDYFSIVYIDSINKKWHFYPDYLVCDSSNNIWIIETKGGETASGESKNIDIKAENKFEALKQYSTKYHVNWAFVRDYDKNNNLYYCNTEYTESMETDEWKNLDELFKKEQN